MKRVIILCFTSVVFCSCATIFTGSKKTVTFTSNVSQPATLTIDGYKMHNVSLPHTMRIQGGFNQTIVKAEVEGYEPELVIINKRFNPIAVLNLLDILSWGIDAATGAITKPDYKFYDIVFSPKQAKDVEAAK